MKVFWSRHFFLLLLCLGAAGDALACKCAMDLDAPPEGSPAAIAADLEGTDAVFTATVIGMQSRARLLLRVPRYLYLTRGDRELTDEEEDRLFRRKVRLRVEEPFKGAEPGRIVLFTGWGGGDCGYQFRRGDRYLVYAGDWSDGLYTGICYPTKPLAEAGSELRVLRRLTSTPAKVGRVVNHHRPSASVVIGVPGRRRNMLRRSQFLMTRPIDTEPSAGLLKPVSCRRGPAPDPAPPV